MKKSLVVILAIMAITFNVSADPKTNFTEALDYPAFKGTDFPSPQITYNQIQRLRVKEFQKLYSKQDVQLMIEYCDKNKIPVMPPVSKNPNYIKDMQSKICRGAKMMVKYY